MQAKNRALILCISFLWSGKKANDQPAFQCTQILPCNSSSPAHMAARAPGFLQGCIFQYPT